MEIKLQHRLQQTLVMTPQLQQAIRLLQLSRLELIEEIRKECDANPVLADEDFEPRPRHVEANAESIQTTTSEQGERRIDMLDDRKRAETGESQKTESKQVNEIDWEQFLENRTLQQPLPANRGGFDDLPPIEQNLTKGASLVDHLNWQIQMSDMTDSEKRFAELVLGNLNDQGFLDLKGVDRPDGTRTPDLTIEELASESGLDPEDAPDVLRMMQEFDPVGVCSRDLRECLLVQAEVFGYEDLDIQILDKHLHNLEKHNYQAIARDLKVPIEDVYESVKEIQKLESRPARNFTDSDEKQIAITPDV